MRTIICLLGTLLLLNACGHTASRATHNDAVTTDPVNYTYRVIHSYPHSTTAYTQGLQYVDGTMWEGTGQNGSSVVQTIDLEKGKADVRFRLPQSEFGEGITLLRDTLYQLTWQSNTAHVYDLRTGKKIRDFSYPGEGWGLTTDGEKLYMSDGTSSIYTLNPQTFNREKRTVVTCKGVPMDYLNELEWIDGKIWANVYTTDRILIINPTTGVVEGMIDLTGLLPESEHTENTDVLNGIAYDKASKRIFVTGKNWSRLFEIEILPR